MTDDSDRAEQARRILHSNDRGGYAVPTARLYPFQWNWDSAFVALGWACFDEPRAWQEILSLLKGQWEDGLIPQIVFHAPSDDYFPGPDVWGIVREPPTSGITQPPVLATAVRLMLETARDTTLAEDMAAAIYPRLLRNHRWWQTARDPGRTGLVATLHPWETGMDNSPAWDAALARVPTETTTVIQRRDTDHVDASARPRGEEYQRFIHLVDIFRDAEWGPARMFATSPFRVTDIGTNAILLRAERDLLALAERFGQPGDAAAIGERIARKEAALPTLWNPAIGSFASFDQISGETIPVATSAGLLPLFAHCASPEHVAAMETQLETWATQTAFLVPSADPADAGFEPLRYWRGPVWAVVNWMIADGLDWAGSTTLAEGVRRDTVRLIAEHGFSEYFDPTDGKGIGGADFSWTAAIYLLLTSARG
jgi:glycogen debranching enzyme